MSLVFFPILNNDNVVTDCWYLVDDATLGWYCRRGVVVVEIVVNASISRDRRQEQRVTSVTTKQVIGLIFVETVMMMIMIIRWVIRTRMCVLLLLRFEEQRSSQGCFVKVVLLGLRYSTVVENEK